MGREGKEETGREGEKEMGREGKEETGREGEERGREGEEERGREGEEEKGREGDEEKGRQGVFGTKQWGHGERGGNGVERRGEDWKSMGKRVKRGEWQERMTGDGENADTRGGTEGNWHCKKRKVNKFDNVDVECTVFENGQKAFDFKPTNREWRIRQC